MGLVTTMGKYCFVECDRPRCSKKIEHVDPKTLKQLAGLCGWERIDDQWICVDCAAESQGETSPSTRQRRPLPGVLKASGIR
jgi:rubredoxin